MWRQIAIATAGFLLTVTTTADAPQQYEIAFFGDSTTKGAQTIGGQLFNTTINEPAIVQNMLQARFGAGVVVNNQGVGGTEAAQLLNGTDGVHPPFDQVMAVSKAKIVVFNFALNDSYYAAKPRAGVPVESVDTYRALMSQLCQIARSHGKICVFEEPNPVYGVQDNPNAPIFGYVSVLRQVAAQMNAPLISQFDQFQALPNWLSWISEDKTHPTDAGYAYKAANTEAVLRPIVEGLLGK
ncbi:GDSL family lipase [Burkholderia multivorans]|uniref:Lipolytic enzyme, G-D-S-L family n=3 Tax=Burkholderia TaxID=32008 RepID=A4JD49_BURVG|nr:lipolytic enzyme, G-D-S-L family [Burkholderia vietnamiensis G4]MCB4347334.1 SGNH/GDSL hydrolase family protein [Burkholderia vietnamiensis]SAJ96456.1 GDSL family lipase [Burkholderia multivorans]